MLYAGRCFQSSGKLLWLGSIALSCSISTTRSWGLASKAQISVFGQSLLSVWKGMAFSSCAALADISICQRPGRSCNNNCPSGSRRAGNGLSNCNGINPSSNGSASLASRCSPETSSSRRLSTCSGTASIIFRKT